LSPTQGWRSKQGAICHENKVGHTSVVFVRNALLPSIAKRVWRYQRGNQNPYIEEEQITQWSKEKGQKNKQHSIKDTHKTKDRITGTTLKTGGELMCSESCTLRVNLVIAKPAVLKNKD
jgi:hypothetical protein